MSLEAELAVRPFAVAEKVAGERHIGRSLTQIVASQCQARACPFGGDRHGRRGGGWARLASESLGRMQCEFRGDAELAAGPPKCVYPTLQGGCERAPLGQEVGLFSQPLRVGSDVEERGLDLEDLSVIPCGSRA